MLGEEEDTSSNQPERLVACAHDSNAIALLQAHYFTLVPQYYGCTCVLSLNVTYHKLKKQQTHLTGIKFST